MAQEVLTWSNSQLNNSRCNFHFLCLFFVLYMYSSQNSLQVSKMWHLCWFTYDLHMIYNNMLRMAVLDRIRGWLYYVSIRGEDNRSEGDQSPGQSIIGIFRFVQAQNTLADWRWPPSYPKRPWKSGKLLFQNPNIDHRNWAKLNTSLRCSKFAIVDHVVYSLWVGWCLFKLGTLPLTLHKFNKIVYFSKFLRKTPRRAKPIPTKT